MLTYMLLLFFLSCKLTTINCDSNEERLFFRSNDEDSGCVTSEGRAGTCTRSGSCSTVQDETSLPVCYTVPFFGTKYYCCPYSSQPGIYARSLRGKNNC